MKKKTVAVTLLLLLIVCVSSCLRSAVQSPANGENLKNSCETVCENEDQSNVDETDNGETTAIDHKSGEDERELPTYDSSVDGLYIKSDFDAIVEDDEIKTVDRTNDIVKVFPVLGKYLQPTGYSAYMLYDRDETPLGCFIAERDFDLAEINSSMINNHPNNRYIEDDGTEGVYILDTWLFEGYMHALEKWPGIELCAFSKSNLILVRMPGDESIMMYNWEYSKPEIMRFGAHSFETFEEGRQYAADQIQRINELAAEIGSFREPGSASLGSNAPMRDYYLMYDSYIPCDTYWEIPLKEDGECETYLLRIFINRFGEPIAETVYKKVEPYSMEEFGRERDKTYEIVFERVVKTEEYGLNEYAALDHIEYVSFIQSLGDLSKVAGIYADAGGYHAIMK